MKIGKNTKKSTKDKDNSIRRAQRCCIFSLYPPIQSLRSYAPPSIPVRRKISDSRRFSYG